MTEEWKDIGGYEGYYQVSSHGQVRGVDRVINNPLGYSKSVRGKILIQCSDGGGYPSVNLSKQGKAVSKNVHRLVAEAFILNTDGKREVNHKDGNKRNNFISNLEWMTSSENNLHAYDIGLKVPAWRGKKGKNHHASKSGKVVSPSGQTFFFEGISAFCSLQGIFGDKDNFSAMLRGDHSHCKGWTRCI